MRQLVLVSLFALGCVGCNAVTNLAPRKTERADDPMLAPYDQQHRARYLHAFPVQDLGPRSGPAEPAPFTPHGQ